MIHLRNSPFFWIAILVYTSFSVAKTMSFAIIPGHKILLFVLLGVLGWFITKPFLGSKGLIGSLLLMLFVSVASVWHYRAFSEKIFRQPCLSESTRMSGELEVHQVLKKKSYGLILKARVMNLQDVNDITRTMADRFIRLTIRDPDSLFLLPGDRITITGWVVGIEGPKNPKSFDMRAHYRTLGMQHQMTCNREDISISGKTQFTLARLPAKWQAGLSEKVTSHLSLASAQLVSALVWGDRSELDPEIRNAFALSGAMHVLSVSGMHVAIIYSGLYLLLGKPGGGKFGRRILRFCLYATAIFSYMLVTGASPAAVRASLMIILFLLGKSMGWNTNVWNLLGVAAFLQLWTDPFVGENLGFQLSFLAMAGILLFTQPLTRCWPIRQKWLNSIWSIVAMSIAAQAFLIPLLLYHFHQFPVTFILSSLVAVPAGYIIVFGAVGLLGLSAFGWPMPWTVLDQTVEIFIRIMTWLACWNPPMYYSFPSLANHALLAMMISLAFYWMYKWRPLGITGCTCGITVFLSLSIHRAQQWNTDEFIIYHSHRGILIDVIMDGKCFAFSDSAMTLSNVEFIARNYRCHKDIFQVANIPLENMYLNGRIQYQSAVLNIDSIQLQIWNGRSQLVPGLDPPEYLLITDVGDPNQLKVAIQSYPEMAPILAASLPWRERNKLIWWLKEKQIGFYDINASGFFKQSL